MRVLLLTEFYYPIIGGTELHVRSLSHALVARGHIVTVVTLLQPGLSSFEMDGEVRVIRIKGTVQRLPWLYSDNNRRFATPFPDPEILLSLNKIIRQEKPEIIHAHNWFVRSYLPLKKLNSAKLVLTLHDYSLVCAKKSFMHHQTLCSKPGLLKCLECASNHYGITRGITTTLTNWSMRPFDDFIIDKYIPVSQSVAYSSGLSSNHYNYQVIPNFIPNDIEKLNPGYAHYLNQLPSNGYLLFVGALGRHKGIDVLLKAYSEMADVPPLVLIGMPWSDTPTEFPPNVYVRHNWPREAVMYAWKNSLIGLVPSICSEACPTVIMEAMVSGTVVIASKIGGVIDIIKDNENGLLVEPGNSENIKQAIRRLLMDSSIRERLRKSSQIKVSKYKASVVVPQIENVYNEVINKVS